MTDIKDQEWAACQNPKVGDVLKWNEPLWAAPNKPRGKRDKIGEQEIIAQLMDVKDTLEFRVNNVRKISSGNAEIKVKKHEFIKRKKTSIEKGNCQKLLTK